MMWLILSALILSSCGYKKQAKEVTKDFFSAIKNEKEEKIAYSGRYPFTHSGDIRSVRW